MLCRPICFTSRHIRGGASGVTASGHVQVEISIGNAEDQYYCQGLELSSLTMGTTSNGLTQLTVPLSSFNCDLSRVDQVRLPTSVPVPSAVYVM